MPPNSRTMSQKDLQDLLKAIEDLARTGNRDQKGTCMAPSALDCSPALFGSTPKEQAQIEMWSRRAELEGFYAVAECLRNSLERFKDRAIPGPRDYAQIPALIVSTAAGMLVSKAGVSGSTDKALFGKLFHALLARGVYLPPSALEAWFFTLAHTHADIDRTVEAFESALHKYMDFYLGHMALEEEVILPEAERVLSAAEWAEIDAAFAQNADPLTGHYPPPAEYERLFSMIVQRAPAPIGLG